MDNVLTLAMRFKRDPDAGMTYFDQSIIRTDESDDETPELAAPKPV